jgi:hypothetical protein
LELEKIELKYDRIERIGDDYYLVYRSDFFDEIKRNETPENINLLKYIISGLKAKKKDSFYDTDLEYNPLLKVQFNYQKNKDEESIEKVRIDTEALINNIITDKK